MSINLNILQRNNLRGLLQNDMRQNFNTKENVFVLQNEKSRTRQLRACTDMSGV